MGINYGCCIAIFSRIVDAIDINQSIVDLLGVDVQFEYEILQHIDGTARRLDAPRFRQGYIFICGDVARI
ncbi:MAG: hypothetical protein ACJAVI_003791 [Candidatus Azotimanducaceae bacterium]|jgi:hypothetical protein